MIMLTCFKVAIRFMEFPQRLNCLKNPHVVFKGAVSFCSFFFWCDKPGKKLLKQQIQHLTFFFSRNGSVDFLKEPFDAKMLWERGALALLSSVYLDFLVPNIGSIGGALILGAFFFLHISKLDLGGISQQILVIKGQFTRKMHHNMNVVCEVSVVR